jgi:endonuclease YncB( thermonuclease family)
MQRAARLFSVLLGVAVLGFFAWWTMPFEIKVVWHNEPAEPGPRLIPAPPRPPEAPRPEVPAPGVAAPQAEATGSAPPSGQAPFEPPLDPAPVARETTPDPAPTVQEATPAPSPPVEPIPAPAASAAPSAEVKPLPKSGEEKKVLIASESAEAERFAALKAEAETVVKPAAEIKRYFGVRVRDSGTLMAEGFITIKLAGILARDADARCADANGKDWACGAEARSALTRLIRGRAITCALPGSAAALEIKARCAVTGIDLSLWMVRQGWAEPEPGSDQALAGALTSAKEAQLGLWRTSKN